jgi:glycosyltransferase involved in cell wall biosynthesis
MHVGLNLVYLVPGETGGTETYARELIPELLAAAPDLRLTAFVNRSAAAINGEWPSRIEFVSVPVDARSRMQWVRGEQQLLPRLAERAGVDLLHSLANTAPAWGRFRRVVTIHDLHHRIVPDAHFGMLGFGMRMLVSLAARRSDRIIVPAWVTRDDLSRFLGTPAAKIDVVHEGFGSRRHAAPIREPELREWLHARERPIALSVSAKRPHKNLARLIGALALIPAARRPLLVMPGYHTRYEEQLRRHASSLGVTDDIRLLGWIDDGQLEGLFVAAACFVFPSLYEGFGLPVLEAMARGVPVACSGRGALDEIAGDAALRFDPESEPTIAAAIERLLSDPREAERLRDAGRERAAQFSWKAAAAGTLASYERALDAPGR